jgi:hypothetical protein
MGERSDGAKPTCDSLGAGAGEASRERRGEGIVDVVTTQKGELGDGK